MQTLNIWSFPKVWQKDCQTPSRALERFTFRSHKMKPVASLKKDLIINAILWLWPIRGHRLEWETICQTSINEIPRGQHTSSITGGNEMPFNMYICTHRKGFCLHQRIRMCGSKTMFYLCKLNTNMPTKVQIMIHFSLHQIVTSALNYPQSPSLAISFFHQQITSSPFRLPPSSFFSISSAAIVSLVGTNCHQAEEISVSKTLPRSTHGHNTPPTLVAPHRLGLDTGRPSPFSVSI